MSIPDSLLSRIRGEFREMPGLRLTAAQACRLWQLDAATCEAVLRMLLAEAFLVRTANDMFMALPPAGGFRPSQLKVERATGAAISHQRRSA